MSDAAPGPDDDVVEAAEADLLDQRREVLDRGDSRPPDIDDLEVPEADALEQSMSVQADDEDDRNGSDDR